MTVFLFLVAGMMLGYAIPVVSSLIFSMLVGRISPGFLSGGGRIKTGFVVAHGVVWTLASAVAGYLIGLFVPEFRPVACVGAAGLLILVLLSNVNEMKKQQGPLQIGGMVLGTVAGFAGGLGIFLQMAKPV